MAVPFSKSKRDEIAEKLKEGARIFASQKGMKKTSVDSLVEYAGISKEHFIIFTVQKMSFFLRSSRIGIRTYMEWHWIAYLRRTASRTRIVRQRRFMKPAV